MYDVEEAIIVSQGGANCDFLSAAFLPAGLTGASYNAAE